MPYVKRKRAVRKAPKRRRANPKTTKKGLNKTEKSQVKTIAKKAVNSLAESKYFHTNSTIAKIVPNPIWKTAAGVVSEISCLGYSTGRGVSAAFGGSAVNINYGVSVVDASVIPMQTLNMNKVFKNDDAIVARRS